MGVIETLIVVLDSIPPIPGENIVQCIAGLAVAVFRVYEDKCFNDSKVGELHRAIAQVSLVLETHLASQSPMVATYREQLKDLTDAIKAAGQWVVAYARRSAMSKYFSANKERRQAELKRARVSDALQALNLAMLSVSSGQIGDMHAAIVSGSALDAPPSADTTTASALPPGWVEQIDPATGRKFYVDFTNKTTTWERPDSTTAPTLPSFYPALFPATPSDTAFQPAALQQGTVATEPLAMGIPVDDPAPTPTPHQLQPSSPALPMAEQHAFVDAAKGRDYQAMMRIAEAYPAVLDVMPSGRWSALHHAAFSGDAEAVQWLLARGADPEALTPQGERPRDVVTEDGECKRLLVAVAPPPRQFSFVIGELGVQADVALQLQCGGSGSNVLQSGGAPLLCSEHEVRPYVLAGPEAAVTRCALEFGGYDRTKRLGFITPAARVTLDPASRAAAGVPAAAAWFAFAHPPTGLAYLSEQHLEELGESGLSEPWLHFLTLGGFCYFDERQALLAVNAITAPGGSGDDGVAGLTRLSFDGPLTADARVLAALRAQGRMHDVTIPELRAAGAERYGWLNPFEAAGGVPTPLAEAWQHGAFLYEPADGAEAIFFRVVAAAPPAPPQLIRTESQALADALQVPVSEVRAARAAEATMLYGP